jgi:hypothetical protein
MSAADRIVGGTGVVRVGPLEVTVTPLTMNEERALRRQLRAAAEAAATDHFTRCAKLLAAMRSQPAAYAEAVREIVRLTATGPAVSDEQFFEYRNSPAGVARELFARGKRATPGLDADGLAAVITDANVDDVIEQLTAVIEAGDPNPSTP